MKKRGSLFLVAVFILSIFLTSCTSKAGSGSEIKIGAVLPLTGDVATFGKSTKQGIELAIEQYNKNGGLLGKQIKLVVEDDENKPESGISATQKLISSEKVVGILGSVASKVVLAMAPVATQNKVPLVTGSSTNAKVTTEKGNEFAFRACFIDPFQGKVIAKFSKDTLKAQTAAVMYDVGNDYSIGLAENFKTVFEQNGGKVVAYKSYNTGATDFNAQLTSIKQLNPDVLILTDYYQTVGLIAKQAKQLGITAKMLGGDGWDSPDLVKIGGDAVNGGYFSNHYSPDDTSADVQQFLKDYKAKFNGETPDALAALGYDAAKMLFEAIKSANSTDGEAIRQALLKTDINSVTGHIMLNSQRDPEKSAVMIKMENGKQVFAGKVNP